MATYGILANALDVLQEKIKIETSNVGDFAAIVDFQVVRDDQLTRYDDTSYAYNDAGQLRSKTRLLQTTTFEYGVLGELERVEFPDGRTIEYEHDSMRRRIARKVEGTYTHRFIYGSNINPIAEVDSGGNTVSTFVYGTGINVPDYMIRAGRTYYFARDHLGSVRYVIDVDDQSIAQVLKYDEYGQVIFDSNPGFQPFGFAGGLYDTETGLTRFGVRDYEARTGRWMARDPIGFGGGQANLYVYAGNNSINLIDPDGNAAMAAAVLIGAGIGAVAGAMSYRVSTPAECRSSAGLVGWVLGGAVGGAVLGVGGWVAATLVSSAVGTMAALAKAAFLTSVGGIAFGTAASTLNYGVRTSIDPARKLSDEELNRAILGGALFSGPIAMLTGSSLGTLGQGIGLGGRLGVATGTKGVGTAAELNLNPISGGECSCQ